MKKEKNKHFELRKKCEAFGSWMRSKCPECGGDTMFFYDRFDAVCCVRCNVWFNAACNNPNCPFCSQRPEKPLDALIREEEPRSTGKEWRRSNYLHKTNGKLRHERRKGLYACKKESYI